MRTSLASVGDDARVDPGVSVDDDRSQLTVGDADDDASGDETAELVPVEHVDPADPVADDELVLTTGRVLEHFNSGAVTRRSGTLMRMRGEDVLQIHPDDAGDRGVEDGQWVRVGNDRGEVSVRAEITPVIRRGTVFMTFHYADSLVNVLTPDELDPVAKVPEYKHAAVRVTVTPNA